MAMFWGSWKSTAKGLAKVIGGGYFALVSAAAYIPGVLPIATFIGFAGAVVVQGLRTGSFVEGLKAGAKTALLVAASPALLGAEAIAGAVQAVTGKDELMGVKLSPMAIALKKITGYKETKDSSSSIEMTDVKSNSQQQHDAQNQQNSHNQQQSIEQTSQRQPQNSVSPNSRSGITSSRPVRDLSDENIQTISSARNYTEARDAYNRETSGAQKFQIAGKETLSDGTTLVTYIPPGMEPDKCPENMKVKQLFSADGKVLSVNGGEGASFVAPPVCNPRNNGFSFAGETVEDVRQQHDTRSISNNMRKAFNAVDQDRVNVSPMQFMGGQARPAQFNNPYQPQAQVGGGANTYPWTGQTRPMAPPQYSTYSPPNTYNYTSQTLPNSTPDYSHMGAGGQYPAYTTPTFPPSQVGQNPMGYQNSGGGYVGGAHLPQAPGIPFDYNERGYRANYSNQYNPYPVDQQSQTVSLIVRNQYNDGSRLGRNIQDALLTSRRGDSHIDYSSYTNRTPAAASYPGR